MFGYGWGGWGWGGCCPSPGSRAYLFAVLSGAPFPPAPARRFMSSFGNKVSAGPNVFVSMGITQLISGTPGAIDGRIVNDDTQVSKITASSSQVPAAGQQLLFALYSSVDGGISYAPVPGAVVILHAGENEKSADFSPVTLPAGSLHAVAVFLSNITLTNAFLSTTVS